MGFFLIAGGLCSVTALRENDRVRVTVYTEHRLTLQALVTEAVGSLTLIRHPKKEDGGLVGRFGKKKWVAVFFGPKFILAGAKFCW